MGVLCAHATMILEEAALVIQSHLTPAGAARRMARSLLEGRRHNRAQAAASRCGAHASVGWLSRFTLSAICAHKAHAMQGVGALSSPHPGCAWQDKGRSRGRRHAGALRRAPATVRARVLDEPKDRNQVVSLRYVTMYMPATS